MRLHFVSVLLLSFIFDQSLGCRTNSGHITTTTSSISTNQCGSPAIAPLTTGLKIVGGNEARENSWPWQVALRIQVSNSTYSCGGSLIDNQVGR